MPRNQVRVLVVSFGDVDALLRALDAALHDEQADQNWHVTEVRRAVAALGLVATAGAACGTYLDLIAPHARQWFLGDMLGAIAGIFGGQSAKSEPPAQYGMPAPSVCHDIVW